MEEKEKMLNGMPAKKKEGRDRDDVREGMEGKDIGERRKKTEGQWCCEGILRKKGYHAKIARIP